MTTLTDEALAQGRDLARANGFTAEDLAASPPARMAFATFSVTGGLASDYVKRGKMIPWQGTLAIEGIETGDKRIIAPDALTWRDLPLPLMFQFENPVGGDGHDGATLTARIDDIVRLDEGRVWARGFIDPRMPNADTQVMAMDGGLIRGVSVDLDMVKQVQVEGPDGEMRTIITSARISGATVCPFQAFMEASITLDAELMQLLEAEGADAVAASADYVGARARINLPVDPIETLLLEIDEALVAAAGATVVEIQPIPVDPPADWFANPNLTELTPLTVTANGRVFGHVAAWGTCHISFANRCQPVPHSACNYAKFRCGSVLTAEGTTVRTGPIVMDTIHPDLRWRASDAMRFYADTGAAICDVVPYEDKFGIAIAGAVRPTVKPAQLRAFRGSDISPDWRNIDGNPHECCAMLAVNNSGFKLPTALAASAGLWIEPGETAFAIDEFDEVYALVASGPMSQDEFCEHCAHADDELSDEDRAARSQAIVERFGGKTRVFKKHKPDEDTADYASKVKKMSPVKHDGSCRTFQRAEFAPKNIRQSQRDKWAKEGVAMPDGSWPIPNRDYLRRAIQSYGRADNAAEVKAWIKKRAKALGAEDMLPEDWK